MLLKRKYLFGTTILAGVIAAAAPSMAQEAQVPGVVVEGQSQVDEIVITGSRIRRDPTNAPTPLIQVSRAELLETGLTTVVDYLATIPALSNSLVPSDTTGSLNATGLSFANLRSLGTGRTLTLVDGRRHIGSAGGSLEVDVDAIPRLLIENIEIITGGASSVYGADAVAGVVNYVLRKDYEGLEIDASYGQLSSVTNKATMRISALMGGNFMDDRLNAYVFGEYEDIDEIEGDDISWLRDGRVVLGTDADPTSTGIGPNTDGVLDQTLFYNARSVGRPRWGVTTIANAQQPSALNDPDVPLTNCAAFTSANCYSIDPTRTYWYENGVARLVNMGTRIGNTGANRSFNIGGDGYNNNTNFSGFSRTPQSQSSRFQTGLNFKVTPDVTAYVEAKFITEDSYIASQPTFFDTFIGEPTTHPLIGGPNTALTVQGVSGNSYFTRLDNAYLPAIIRNAMLTNMVTTWNAATNTAPGTAGASTLRQWARHSAFGPDRTQFNTREVTRFVAGLNGGIDELGFIHNFSWDLSYTFGELQNSNQEIGFDKLRFSHALDAVVDTAGAVNGRPGEIVCRVRLIAATAPGTVSVYNPFDSRFVGGTTPGSYLATDPEVRDCVPINMFGDGNQTEEALAFIGADITVLETNEQEDAVAAISGQLWDFFGAGAMGLAFGAEYRREYTEGVGRDADTAGRFLQLNTGADFPAAQYESEELFAEISLPLIRDSWLGEYAELSASYRQFDYTTAGEGDVYGVNLIYRPIQDITFKSSFNTSFRAPNLAENFRPRTQTFANGFVDPCSTTQIVAPGNAQFRDNRIANCTALAAAKGLAYDFAGSTVSAADDYLPIYAAGIAGVSGGNPGLKPEESESFTFSTVLEPRFFPNLALILDYYEIEITDVIATVGAQVLANQCVDGPSLNPLACGVIFRNNPAATGDGFEGFKVGAPTSDPVGGFIIGSFNYAKRETRGLDFTIRYSLDTEEVWGKNWGTFNWNLGGLWLIDQQAFNDATNPAAFTESSSSLFFPRVRFTSRLTWAPNEDLAVTWTTDWQTSQDINKYRDIVASGNIDALPPEGYESGNFARHDLSVRYHVNDELTVRAGVTNLFDAQQAPWLGSTLYSNFDPYGRRFNIGLNYRAW